MTTLKHKIIPHLWYDTEAREAAQFYCSLFPDSKISNITTLHDTPSGDCDVVSFELSGQPFMAISAGPYFKFNPSISFILNFDPSRDKNARKNLDATWEQLLHGGTPLMPLDKYPFSERYGWIQDKYGLSWQLILSNPDGEERPFIVPSLMFVGDIAKAEEATNFYLSVFQNTKRGQIVRYPAGMEPNSEGTIMFTDFMINNQWFAAMDASASQHKFAFNEAISFMVPCDTQEEIEYFWKKLSAVPEAEQCGWCKDKYGLSWQIHPAIMDEMMKNGTREQIDRLTKAFLPMKKFDIAKLKKAYEER
jgi:predicted 3-demethylubiquinone-9 3-methyltransferase (glyoxalase superfamily)